MEKKINTDLVIKIANRASKIYSVDRFAFIMDITYCIEGGCNLDLNGLLNADETNFMHDMAGIHNHLNRETKKLDNCFVPRYTTNG